MRKYFLISMLLGLVTILTVMPAMSQERVNKKDLVNKGFSPYLANISMLQADKHEGKGYEIPDKVQTWFLHVMWGDFSVPSESFGYYNIGSRD